MINGILPSAPVESGAPASTLNPQPTTLDSAPSTINAQPSAPALNPQSSILNSPPPPSFPLCPGETPRAFAAFMAFFKLGYGRSLKTVAGHLSEKLKTVQSWSSKFHWSDRINAYNSGLLEQQAQAGAEARRKEAADWAHRSNTFREQQWGATQKLLAAAQCFLESYGDRELAHMSLSQVSRALQVAYTLGRQTLADTAGSQEPALTPLQVELEAALKRAYSQPLPAAPEVKLSHPGNTPQ